MTPTPLPFSTHTLGIGGRIKARYSDFVVEEVLNNGSVCEVTTFLEKGFDAIPTPLKIPPKPEGKDHVHLDLEKINKDFSNIVKRLSRFARVSKKRIGYAGLKDRRGITCQRISIFQPDPELLQKFHIKGVELRNPSWEKERIELGDHSENRFTITIRNSNLSETEIKKRIETSLQEMTENGIASFFGEQRFGGLRNITHRVGEHIVKGEYEQAVMLYLTETFLEEQEEVKAVRNELAHSRDFAKALKAFPLECGFERAMTSHLHTHPNDWIGAIQAIPKQMRFLFTHALQSWLFNEVIAERMKQGIGLHKTEGDILEEGIPTAPLFGFASEFAAGIPGNIEQQVLERQGLSLSSFKIKDIPELSSKGARKQIMAFPIEPELIKIEDDAFFIGMKATTIRFRLKKGLYATTVTREIIK